jgi:hypothetical protein
MFLKKTAPENSQNHLERQELCPVFFQFQQATQLQGAGRIDGAKLVLLEN